MPDVKRSLSFPEGFDRNVEAVVRSFVKRSELGQKKYGVTTERTDLDLFQWLQHLKEELMDATIYLERIQYEFSKLDKVVANANKEA